MAFPRDVAEKALVACGRCCCLCHQFCGLKMELHHILEKADGGDDSFENCIPLCFDCHADQRSYDSKHPKGRKYTREELRSHRDRWYQQAHGTTASAAAAEAKAEAEAAHGPKGAEPRLQIVAIADGHDLLGALAGAHAYAQRVDEATSEAEAELVASLLDMLEVAEIWDDLTPGDRYRYGHRVSSMLSELEALSWGVCVVWETRTVEVASQEIQNWRTATLRMAKLDPRLVKAFAEGLRSGSAATANSTEENSGS